MTRTLRTPPPYAPRPATAAGFVAAGPTGQRACWSGAPLPNSCHGNLRGCRRRRGLVDHERIPGAGRVIEAIDVTKPVDDGRATVHR